VRWIATSTSPRALCIRRAARPDTGRESASLSLRRGKQRAHPPQQRC
jgi:hypothetical protein